jgi:hypothetical protein
MVVDDLGHREQPALVVPHVGEQGPDVRRQSPGHSVFALEKDCMKAAQSSTT